MSPWPQETLLHGRLSAIKGSHARLAWVVERARHLPPFSHGERVDANLVEGCLSQLWLRASIADGRCVFQCDSDSLIVKGIGSLICESCSGRLPVEIVARRNEPPLLTTSFASVLTQNRRNGLLLLWGQIVVFARAQVSDLVTSP